MRYAGRGVTKCKLVGAAAREESKWEVLAAIASRLGGWHCHFVIEISGSRLASLALGNERLN